MDQIGEQHQFERQFCPVDNISPAAYQSLDTVRALHQTVVSLRTALEAAHREIDTLKRQIVVTSDIRDGKAYHVQDKDIPLTDSGASVGNEPNKESRVTDFRGECVTSVSNINIVAREEPHVVDVVEQPHQQQQQPPSEPAAAASVKFNANTAGNVGHADEELNATSSSHTQRKTKSHSVKSHRFVNVEKVRISDRDTALHKLSRPDIRIITHPKHSKQMASKIDVKIRLSSDIKVNGSSSETGSDTNSGTDTPRDESNEKSETENNDSTESNADEVQPNQQPTTSVVIEEITEPKDTYEPDDVFLAEGEVDKDCLQPKPPKFRLQSPNRSTSDNQEEVDDIELIFSSDDKELTQEDLISIAYYEPWQKCGQSGTPVLTNFASIGSDQEANNDSGNEAGGETRDSTSSPTEIDVDRFYNAIKQSVAQQNSMHSNDSLNQGERRGGGIGKFSSLDRDSDNEGKDDSFDTFEQTNYKALGRRWTNYNVLMETDISKCGISEENEVGMRRRNTCPNPPAYRPIIHREAIRRYNQGTSAGNRCPLAVKFSRNARSQQPNADRSPRPIVADPQKDGPKRSSSAQTDISALPEHWRSESHLSGGALGSAFFTLPSKFMQPPGLSYYRCPLKLNNKTREARRVLLSDINFTSMVPELSRSADHLCQGEDQQNTENNNGSSANVSGQGLGEGNSNYYKGSHLKTPDYVNRGITPSVSMTSPGISQWTVNENSFGAQSTQTDNYGNAMHGDSFDSCRDFSMGSKYSTSFGKQSRSRSCSSVRCNVCKNRHRGGIKTSESMHQTPLVTFAEPNRNKTRASLPDLRSECACGCVRNRNLRCSNSLRFGDSYGSTESLIDEAEDFLCKSIDGVFAQDDEGTAKGVTVPNRRCSENDIKRDYSPSKHTLPFLPKSPKCLKPGHLAKVIAKNGRCVIGRVRYVGPLVSIATTATNTEHTDNETFIGLQLPNKIGDCDGSFENRKFFDCEPNYGMFVPFKKIVMAWTS